MEEENIENINPEEKKKLLKELQIWLYFLDDTNDMDMIYQLIDMKTEWEEEIERNSPEDESL
jgi:DNA-directed RNA polymerase subunit H (RpoH/RPB5)